MLHGTISNDIGGTRLYPTLAMIELSMDLKRIENYELAIQELRRLFGKDNAESRVSSHHHGRSEERK